MKSLYVTDRTAIGDRRFSELLTELADAPGLTVELREKAAEDRACLAWARLARERLGTAVPLYVNRRFDVALLARAEGVHLPADGFPLSSVRAQTPRGFRIGVSTHSPEEAEAAIDAGADLIVLGPIFDTPSKRAFGQPLGPAVLERLPLASSHASEVFAIGGIDEARSRSSSPTAPGSRVSPESASSRMPTGPARWRSGLPPDDQPSPHRRGGATTASGAPDLRRRGQPRSPPGGPGRPDARREGRQGLRGVCRGSGRRALPHAPARVRPLRPGVPAAPRGAAPPRCSVSSSICSSSGCSWGLSPSSSSRRT